MRIKNASEKIAVFNTFSKLFLFLFDLFIIYNLNIGGLNMSKKAVFFDCWDTVITFSTKIDNWNQDPLLRHIVEKNQIDIDAINKFISNFLNSYYSSLSLYEIEAEQLYNLVLTTFNLHLDCTVSACSKEILSNLNPKPVEGIDRFLKCLDNDDIYYAIL